MYSKQTIDIALQRKS